MRPGRALIFQFDLSVSQASDSHRCLGTCCKSAGAALCWGPLPPTPCCLLTCTNCLQVLPRRAGDGYLLYHSLQWSPSMPAPPYSWINFSSTARSSTDRYSRVNDRLCSQFCLLYICLLLTVTPAGSCTSSWLCGPNHDPLMGHAHLQMEGPHPSGLSCAEGAALL